MAVETAIIERKQAHGGEDSAHTDARLIKNFVSANPNSRIITIFHSGVKHLIIVYEAGDVPSANIKPPVTESSKGRAGI